MCLMVTCVCEMLNMREKDESGNFVSTMPIYLNVVKSETKNTNMPDDGNRCWHDDSVTVYWKGEWELDEYGIPHAL